MNTNLPPDIAQIVTVLPPWYQAHWPALMLLAGIVTHAAHRIIALGGLRGLWRLIWTGTDKPISVESNAAGTKEPPAPVAPVVPPVAGTNESKTL